MKNNKNALLALLAAGGLYAWKNRDKIQGWVNTQRDQMQSQYGSEPSTGATRRIGSEEYGTSGPRIYGEPFDQQI